MPDRERALVETRNGLAIAQGELERVARSMSAAICEYFDALEDGAPVPTKVFARLAAAADAFEDWRGMPVRHSSVLKWKAATDD